MFPLFEPYGGVDLFSLKTFSGGRKAEVCGYHDIKDRVQSIPVRTSGLTTFGLPFGFLSILIVSSCIFDIFTLLNFQTNFFLRERLNIICRISVLLSRTRSVKYVPRFERDRRLKKGILTVKRCTKIALSPVLTSDASISRSLKDAYALVRTATT